MTYKKPCHAYPTNAKYPTYVVGVKNGINGNGVRENCVNGGPPECIYFQNLTTHCALEVSSSLVVSDVVDNKSLAANQSKWSTIDRILEFQFLSQFSYIFSRKKLRRAKF